MTNRKYTCHICDADFEHDSDAPLDRCLKCDGEDQGPGEDTWHDVEYVHKCPFCDVWMVREYDGEEVCPQCNSYFDDYESIAHTLKCLAFYDAKPRADRPTIVCLCGSTRFMEAFFDEGWRLTLEGKIVLSVGVCKHADEDGAHGAEALGPDVVKQLDELHLRKIDLADEVRILNVGGYIGESTGKELAYARKQGKVIRFLEEEK